MLRTRGRRPVRIPITDVFDLHTVPPRDVRAVVEEYLTEAHRLGYRALRIIHGRGIGVQREMVRCRALENPLRSRVPRCAGGSGRLGRHHRDPTLKNSSDLRLIRPIEIENTFSTQNCSGFPLYSS